MKEFDVYIQDKPGELAKVAEILGRNGVNIKAISSERSKNEPMVRIVTDDEATAHTCLTRASVRFGQRDVLTVRIIDRPGELGKIARKLARAMVNVNSIYILGKDSGMTEMAITVDDEKKAKNALK